MNLVAQPHAFQFLRNDIIIYAYGFMYLKREIRTYRSDRPSKILEL